MIKIYTQNVNDSGRDCRTFFDLNQQEYKIVNDINDSWDISLEYIDNEKPILILQCWHNFDNQYDTFLPFVEDQRVHVLSNAVKPGHLNSQILFNDLWANITRAYYTNFKFSPGVRPAWFVDQKSYRLDKISSGESKTKIFVSPLRIPNIVDHRIYRYKFNNLMCQHYTSLGFTGFLYSNFTKDIFKLIKNPPTVMPVHRKGYNPPHNDYYNNSCISIYMETIEVGSTIAVTEKTYDPLIKGHFILPFSSAGFIDHLRSIGIALPDFIDYSYDREFNDDLRYKLYVDEVRRLMDISLPQWRELWDKNIDLIRYNREWFFNRDYDCINLYNLI